MNYVQRARERTLEIEKLNDVPQIEINNFIDYTLLRPDALYDDIEDLVNTAITRNYHAVCVNPFFIPKIRNLLKGKNIKICSVVGFPLGANSLRVKLFEAEDLMRNGVDEIDMVINISALKSKDYRYVENEIREVAKICPHLKVIIETCLLTDEEKVIVSEIVKNSGAKFVKTSTGFSKYGATIFDVALLREVVGKDFGVKASGGIRDKITAIKMILAGANRIGTSSAL